MDGFFVLIAIFGIINMVIRWAKKQQASQNSSNQGAAPDKPWQRMMGDMAKTLEESISGKQPVKQPVPTPVYKTLKAPISTEGMGSGEGSAQPGSIAGWKPPYIAGGSAASPYSLQSEGVSRLQEPLPQWRGSLPGSAESVSFTAKAADTQLVPDLTQESHSALSLAFNRDSLLRAVVMHEILTRPQERRRRWSPR